MAFLLALNVQLCNRNILKILIRIIPPNIWVGGRILFRGLPALMLHWSRIVLIMEFDIV
jgi:hypothetical protein